MQNVSPVTSLFWCVIQLLSGLQQSVVRHIPISEPLRCESPVFKSPRCGEMKGKSISTDISKEILQEEGMRQDIDFAREVCVFPVFTSFSQWCSLTGLVDKAGRMVSWFLDPWPLILSPGHKSSLWCRVRSSASSGAAKGFPHGSVHFCYGNKMKGDLRNVFNAHKI